MHRSTFLPIQPAAILIFSVDSDLRNPVTCSSRIRGEVVIGRTALSLWAFSSRGGPDYDATISFMRMTAPTTRTKICEFGRGYIGIQDCEAVASWQCDACLKVVCAEHVKFAHCACGMPFHVRKEPRRI